MPISSQATDFLRHPRSVFHSLSFAPLARDHRGLGIQVVRSCLVEIAKPSVVLFVLLGTPHVSFLCAVVSLLASECRSLQLQLQRSTLCGSRECSSLDGSGDVRGQDSRVCKVAGTFADRFLLLRRLAPDAVSWRSYARGECEVTHFLLHHACRTQPVAQRYIRIVFVFGCLVGELLHAQRRAEGCHGNGWRGSARGDSSKVRDKLEVRTGDDVGGRELDGGVSFEWRGQFTDVCFARRRTVMERRARPPVHHRGATTASLPDKG